MRRGGAGAVLEAVEARVARNGSDAVDVAVGTELIELRGGVAIVRVTAGLFIVGEGVATAVRLTGAAATLERAGADCVAVDVMVELIPLRGGGAMVRVATAMFTVGEGVAAPAVSGVGAGTMMTRRPFTWPRTGPDRRTSAFKASATPPPTSASPSGRAPESARV